MPIAAVVLRFDPTIRFGELVLRLETLGFAVAILASLAVAGLIVRRPAAWWGAGGRLDVAALRVDDLFFVVLAAIPGAVAGGRIGYALLHLDYYLANPGALVDPAQGSLELGLAVIGGALTGGYAARLLTRSAGAWFHAAALPTLLAIGIGKAAMVLGGSGQGAPASAAWAIAYAGPGPWGSLGANVPSHPAQLYEAMAAGFVLLLVLAFAAAGGFVRRDGRAWLAAIGGWAAARVVIAATWRDTTVVGPLRAGQLLAIAIVVGCGVAWWAVGRRREESRTEGSRADEPGVPRWPEPQNRPRF